MVSRSLLLLAAVLGTVLAECPPSNLLNRVNCMCIRPGARVRCRDVVSEGMMKMIMSAVEGYELQQFTLINANLEHLPSDMFSSISTREFVLKDSNLQSFTSGEDDTSLFRGSGIKNFTLVNSVIQDGDLTPIGDLNDLQQFILSGYHGEVHLGDLANLLPTEQLNELGLDDMNHLVWQKGVLDEFHNLHTLALTKLGFTFFERDDLPAYAENLENLWLRDNKLTGLPADLLSNMPHLETLDISSTGLETLDEETFLDFHGYLGLHDNKLVCDDRLNWLRRRLRRGTIKFMYVQRVLCDDGEPFYDP